MPDRRLLRAAALAVAALLLWGETGAADLDALLYHSGGTPVAAAVNHVESRGAGQRHHADHCLADFRLLARGAAAPAEGSGPPPAAPEHAVALPPPALGATAFRGFHQRSRAPPASLA
jgi:hypothetical protein